MADRKVIEVLRSGSSRYEIVRVNWSMIGLVDYRFFVFRDGEEVAGAYHDLRDAVAWAMRQGAS